MAPPRSCVGLPVIKPLVRSPAARASSERSMRRDLTSLGCAGQIVRPSLHSISQTSAGTPSIFEVTQSLFPSLMLEGSPLGGPERACITRHWRRSSADRRDRAREPPKRCERACWRARLPACCGAAASMPAQSKATSPASPHLGAAPARRRDRRPMAATNKCLAQNNKSRHVSRATKGVYS
jgi:hypothetical protein